MKNIAQIALLVLWIVIIFVLTGYPSLKTPDIDKFPADKVYHFALFFIFGILAFRLVGVYLFFLLGMGIAIVAEVQQIFISGRNFEILDIAAGILGLTTFFVIHKLRSIYKHGVSKT